jgi:hypothetical protein
MTGAYPPLDDLLVTVRDFLMDIRQELDGARRYHAQVAAYLLEIALRELQDRGGEAAVENDFGADMERFRLAIRSGAFDARDAALRSALLRDAIAAVAMTRPDHLHPDHRNQPR